MSCLQRMLDSMNAAALPLHSDRLLLMPVQRSQLGLWNHEKSIQIYPVSKGKNGFGPSLLGWRPSLLGWRPSLLGWMVSLITRLEVITTRLKVITTRSVGGHRS